MINKKIIEEFERLVAFIRDETDKLVYKKNTKMVSRNNFRLKIIRNIIGILKDYPKKITLTNFQELKDIRGIGKGTLSRIEEILKKGYLKEVGQFVDIKKDKKDDKSNITEVVGIGRTKALEFFNLGIKDVKTLKKNVKNNQVDVNDKIKLGLKYHGVYKTKIPRKEIDEIYKMLKKIIKKMNKKYSYSKEKQYCVEICGSYRREKNTSNDIDVLLTKLKTTDESSKNDKHLSRFVKKLKKKIKLNQNQPLLVDDMTDKHIKTKYMGFCKYKKKPVRRIDIRFIPYSSYASALLYFTGSSDLNKKMRTVAIKKGYKLSEYGLFKKDGTKIKTKTERDIFKKLGLEYIVPRLR